VQKILIKHGKNRSVDESSQWNGFWWFTEHLILVSWCYDIPNWHSLSDVRGDNDLFRRAIPRVQLLVLLVLLVLHIVIPLLISNWYSFSFFADYSEKWWNGPKWPVSFIINPVANDALGNSSWFRSIVWTISTCASLDRRVLEFRFQAPISLGCVSLGNLSGSNWIWPCGFLKNNLPIVSVQIR
jgi:hypothetical protein